MKQVFIVMRPHYYMDEVRCFKTLQDLQYVVTTDKPDMSGHDACKEVLMADQELLLSYMQIGGECQITPDDYTVLGRIVNGVYHPWLNGKVP